MNSALFDGTGIASWYPLLEKITSGPRASPHGAADVAEGPRTSRASEELFRRQHQPGLCAWRREKLIVKKRKTLESRRRVQATRGLERSLKQAIADYNILVDFRILYLVVDFE